MKINKKSIGIIAIDILYIIAGSILFSLALNLFLVPKELILGGASGIATVINKLINGALSMGTLLMLINVPLFIGSYFVFGWRFILKTLVGTVASSVFTDLFLLIPTSVLPQIPDEPLLCAIFGGVTMGAGLGLIYCRGYNTGGSDMAVMMLKKAAKKISTGTSTFIIDSIIIVASALALQNIQIIFYAIIIIFIETKVMDMIITGSDNAKAVYIISDRNEEIAEKIAEKLERGITVLPCMGWYSKKQGEMLMCVIRPFEVYNLKTVIKSVDPNAFIIFCEADRVLGLGFIENESEHS